MALRCSARGFSKGIRLNMASSRQLLRPMRFKKNFSSGKTGQRVEESTTETVSTFEKKVGDTVVKSTTITMIKDTLASIPPFYRRLGYVYIGLGTLNMGYLTYNDGKEGLHKFRLNRPKPYPDHGEWNAVRWACKEKSFRNFMNSVLWPKEIISNIMPKLVLILNKE